MSINQSPSNIWPVGWALVIHFCFAPYGLWAYFFFNLRQAFIENVKRAHFQTVLWRNPGSDPSQLNPEDFGWKKDAINKSLYPTTLPENSKPAPDFILEIIRCGCKSQPLCSTKRCSCRDKGLPCTMFCACFSVGCSSNLN